MQTNLSRRHAMPEAATTIRRLKPRAKSPTAAVLRRLADSDRELLVKRLTEPSECVYDADFRRSSAVDIRAFTTDERQTAPAPGNAPESVTSSDGTWSPSVVLSADDERTLFRRFNYCRYRAMRILHAHRGKRLHAGTIRELLRWEHMALETRAAIVRANTSLVLAMARRSRNSGVELTELVSEGNLALLRCVDKFDVSRGFKFSTYACRAILASFSRAGAKAARQRGHFPTTYDPAMERSDYLDRKRERVELECVEELRQILFENTAELSAVERRVLDARFSIGRDIAPKNGNGRRTLDQVGMLLGVSKERVRQIQNQAMSKLKAALEQRLPAAS